MGNAREFLLGILLISNLALAETVPLLMVSLPQSLSRGALLGYSPSLSDRPFSLFVPPSPWSCGGAFIVGSRNLTACSVHPFLRYHV